MSFKEQFPEKKADKADNDKINQRGNMFLKGL